MKRWFNKELVSRDATVEQLKKFCEQRVAYPFTDSYFVDMADDYQPIKRDSLDGQMLDAIVFNAILDKLELLALYEKFMFGKQSNEDKLEMIFEIMRRSGMITPANRNESPINPEEGD
jgi:hypothetical protein